MFVIKRFVNVRGFRDFMSSEHGARMYLVEYSNCKMHFCNSHFKKLRSTKSVHFSILKVRIRFAFKLSNLQTPFKIVLVDSFGDGDKTINDFLMNFEVKKNLDLDLWVTWKLGQHVMSMCEELSSQNNFRFEVFDELENRAHLMKLFMHFQDKTNLDLGVWVTWKLW